MTNTDTADAIGTAIQVKELALAGSEMVRITVNTPEAAQAVPYVREQLDRMGVDVPLIGDFHYNGHRLLADFPDCAKALSKYRINPGNVGKGDKKDRQFGQMIEVAMQWNKPVRIGVNWGSLDQELLAAMMDENSKRAVPWDAKPVMYEALITSAISSAQLAQELGMPPEQIMLSCKVSGVQDLVAVYRELARRCTYPLHLGLTEAGMGTKGTVASSAALAVLLQEGIGDTIRVSLTPAPGEARTQEVVIASEILQALGLRTFYPVSPPARVVDEPPVPRSRNSPNRLMIFCVHKCRCGAIATPVWRTSRSLSWAALSMGLERASTQTSASACRVLARPPPRRFSSMERSA